jgi:hypothetical protein
MRFAEGADAENVAKNAAHEKSRKALEARFVKSFWFRKAAASRGAREKRGLIFATGSVLCSNDWHF